MFAPSVWTVLAVPLRANGLGWIGGLALGVALFGPARLLPLAIFLIGLSVFHFSEFLLDTLTHPTESSKDSFLLHIVPYNIAFCSAVIEFLLELYWWPEMKETYRIASIVTGAILMASGETIRKLAILTAQHNFTLHIAEVKEKNHHLVTHGIYRYVRHPAYFGWFVWCLGTQILLANPANFVLYAMVSFMFFFDRIRYEDLKLREFFGDEYRRYARRTPCFVPLIGSTHRLL